MGSQSFALPTIGSVGPRVPNCTLYEGANSRKMVSVIVDFSQIPVLNFDPGQEVTLNYPEFDWQATLSGYYYGFQIVEFDLNTVANGIGLSEVRSVMAYCRPSFASGNGAPGPGSDFVAPYQTCTTPLLSNVASGQTVPLGGRAIDSPELNPAITLFSTSFQSFPFFGSGQPIPIRILNVVLGANSAGPPPTGGAPAGRYQIQFCNWDVRPYEALGYFGQSD